jgi:redox-sensing transcriptional repressor
VKNITNIKNEISLPAITRLCALYQLILELESAGKETVSSTEIGIRLGVGAHNIRKDISHLGIAGNSGTGYELSKLKELIVKHLGFNQPKLVCVVGLGRLGSAILQYPSGEEFEIAAAFDSNINKIETIKTTINLFPAYQITDVVKEKRIELGIIAVPAGVAQDVADKLVDGGIKGIVNFAPVVIRPKCENVNVRNMDIAGELRILSALVNIFPGEK